MQWLIFGLMTAALLSAFRAVWVEVFARHSLRSEVIAQRAYMGKHEAALTWALRSAACLVILAVMGLWRLAGWVAR